MIKKYLWPSLVLLGAFVLIALVMTFSQVGLPTSLNRGVPKTFGLGGGTMENLKMSVDRASIASPAPASSASTPNIPRKITKTGNLSILVETAEATAQNIQTIAESVAGYVSESNLYEVTPGVKAGAITIRVPADKFDQTISRIKKLAIKVETENINANDVTDQFIDLEARLKNLKAEESQYLDILKKAQKIEDIVNVTNRLNEVRQQIDSWQGQLKYLNSQVDLSTITVNLTAEEEVQIFGLHWRPITVVKQAVRSLLNGLVNYANLIIAVIIFLPVVALWIITVLLVTWLLWWGIKKLKRVRLVNSFTKKKTKKPIA